MFLHIHLVFVVVFHCHVLNLSCLVNLRKYFLNIFLPSLTGQPSFNLVRSGLCLTRHRAAAPANLGKVFPDLIVHNPDKVQSQAG